jgi:hypothetical protein
MSHRLSYKPGLMIDMKILCPALLLFLLPAGVSAQALPDSSGAQPVSVMQMKWSFKLNIPALNEDPLRANSEHTQAERDMKDTIRLNGIRGRQGLPPEVPPVRVRAPEKGDHRPSTIYTYEAKVRNNGEKAIRTLIWEYVFFEPGTEQEVGRRRFISRTSISPGKTTNLVMRSSIPPIGAIDATKVDKKNGSQYVERVVIQTIEYADGSVWMATTN